MVKKLKHYSIPHLLHIEMTYGLIYKKGLSDKLACIVLILLLEIEVIKGFLIRFQDVYFTKKVNVQYTKKDPLIADYIQLR